MPTRAKKVFKQHGFILKSYDGEVDIDRLGNLVQQRNTISKGKQGLSIYYNEENFENFHITLNQYCIQRRMPSVVEYKKMKKITKNILIY